MATSSRISEKRCSSSKRLTFLDPTKTRTELTSKKNLELENDKGLQADDDGDCDYDLMRIMI